MTYKYIMNDAPTAKENTMSNQNANVEELFELARDLHRQVVAAWQEDCSQSDKYELANAKEALAAARVALQVVAKRRAR